MEIRNLKTFLKVAALQNFTHAARELGYSQANVSAQIRQLEEEVGMPLFNRIGRTVSLTQFGEQLLPYAQSVCSTAAEMENLARSEETMTGTVKIGLTDSISELLLEDAFIAYHKRFPKVQLEISLDTTAMLLRRLRRDELDAALIITDPLPGTEWLIWAERAVPIVVAANKDLPIAKKRSVTMQELAVQEQVMMETEAPYSIQFERALSLDHLNSAPVFRLQSAETALRIIERGPFISVLPLYTVKPAADAGRVKILNVPRWEHNQVIQTILHRSKTLTPQITGFLEETHRILDVVLESHLRS